MQLCINPDGRTMLSHSTTLEANMQRRTFLRIAGGGTIVAVTAGATYLAGSASALPPEAIEAWRGPNAGLANADVRRWILSYAILAPHSHNLQSWIVDLSRSDEIWLRCDAKRLLPETDPLSRQIMMSHGTFLELLDLAARERGLRADITLFPEGAFDAATIDGRPVARIQLTPEAGIAKDPLFGHILQRRTNRSAYDMTRPPSPATWQAIAASVTATSIRVGMIGLDNPAVLAAHRQIAKEAWKIELTTPRTLMESYNVLRVGKSEIAQFRDGITITDPLVVALDRVGLFDRTKAPSADDAGINRQIKSFDANIDATPGFLWIVSATNDRVAQINAGRAYARLQLAATAQGLSMQPLSQALQEYPEQRVPYAGIHRLLGATASGQTVQMWARLGYAPKINPAPRRRLQDFIVAG